ncbi:MAG: Crp/Fnr family transcriptional regulator [Verrucomicrobiales bacterium]
MQDESQPHEILPAGGVLADLDETIRHRLTAAGEFLTLPEGKYLAIQGQLPETLSFILSGSVSVKSHAHGDTVELAKLGAGESIGEMATIDPRPASASVRTNEETQVWQISRQDFDAFLESDTAAGYLIMKALAKELCGRIRRDTERSLREADQRHTDSYRADY